MKKLLLSLVCTCAAISATAANYTVDFNSTIDTSDPAFKVAPGWKHLVNTGSYAAKKLLTPMLPKAMTTAPAAFRAAISHTTTPGIM